jgi:hypothetical protein
VFPERDQQGNIWRLTIAQALAAPIRWSFTPRARSSAPTELLYSTSTHGSCSACSEYLQPIGQMVGRWIGLMPRGSFVQLQLGKASKVPGELVIGWAFHYIVGAGYGLLLVAIRGADWLRQPVIAAPMTLALMLLVLPYFLMMPGMGMGIAASRAPKPNVARLMSILGHSVFGSACTSRHCCLTSSLSSGALNDVLDRH